MKAFRFAFEHVLEFRRENENRARIDYLETMDKLETEKKKLKKMYADWDAASDEIFNLQRTKSAPLARITFLNHFIEGQKIRAEMQRQVIRNLQMIVEKKQEILISAAQEYEIIKKLKKNQFAAFKKEMNKREAKAIDEMVVTRYRRREAV